MMLLHTLPHRYQRQFRTFLEHGELNTGTVKLNWNSVPVVPAAYDPNVEGSYPAAGAVVPMSAVVPAFIYFVTARSTVRQFAEFQDGDVIVTFDVDLADANGDAIELTALQDLSFTLPDGLEYTQQNAGTKAVEYWDAFIGGEAMSKTLLLRVSPQGRTA